MIKMIFMLHTNMIMIVITIYDHDDFDVAHKYDYDSFTIYDHDDFDVADNYDYDSYHYDHDDFDVAHKYNYDS